MRMSNLAALLAISIVGGVACSDDPIGATQTKVALKIVSLTPDTVFHEGGETVTVTVENGCKLEKLSGRLRDIDLSSFQEVSANVYSFTTPPIAVNAPSSETLSLTCAEPADPTKFAYETGKNTATATLVVDPRLEPAPIVQSHGPVGERISVLAKMTVTFSRAMDPATITKENFYIDGVDGSVSYNETTREAVFTPNEQLEYGTAFTAVVKGGESGVRSKNTGKTLRTTLKPGGGLPDPTQDSWLFTTRLEGEGNPWVGDISAAAGISTGGNYKLFSVTGQPTPVGEAFAGTPENHTYKLQAGFVYATQPAAQED